MIRSLTAAIFLLAGCSSSNEPTALGQVLTVARPAQNVSDRFRTLAQSPRPVLQVALIDKGVNGNMLFEGRDGPYSRYISPDLSGIVLQDGMLHSIYGLGEGLMASELSGPRALILGGRDGIADRFHTYLTGNDETRTRTYRCMIKNEGLQTITLPSGPARLRLMSEDCKNLDQAFRNFYWIDPAQNRIIQTRQWAGENLGTISTRILQNEVSRRQ